MYFHALASNLQVTCTPSRIVCTFCVKPSVSARKPRQDARFSAYVNLPATCTSTQQMVLFYKPQRKESLVQRLRLFQSLSSGVPANRNIFYAFIRVLTHLFLDYFNRPVVCHSSSPVISQCKHVPRMGSAGFIPSSYVSQSMLSIFSVIGFPKYLHP